MDLKQKVIDTVVSYRDQLNALSDYIYDHPETGFHEIESCKAICNVLKDEGFSVQTGVGDIDTAFRAEYEQGKGGPAIGILIEYDAIRGLGHACAHHIQSAVMIYMMKAIKECLGDQFPYKFIVYGTPAEEGGGGKILMADAGLFRDMDLFLMVHGWQETVVDTGNRATSKRTYIFHGKPAHAALAPWDGVSALDALLLTFQGIEFLREHVEDDIRIHYSIDKPTGPANVVHDEAVASVQVRSLYKSRMLRVWERVEKIAEGACLMTGASFESKSGLVYDSKIPANILNKLIVDNARALDAPGLQEPKLNGGSSDMANVMSICAGSCLRIQIIDDGSSCHSINWLNEGKTEQMHGREVLAAQILAGVVYDLITTPGLVKEIQDEYERNREKADCM